MKRKHLMTSVLTCLFIMGILIPLQAQETGENRNLFETAGKKQTNKDFKPAPDKKEQKVIIDSTVEMFLNTYGV